MGIIESSDFIKENHAETLQYLIDNKMLPMFFYGSSVYGDSDPFLSHVILERPELSDFKKDVQDRVNSPYFLYFRDIFYSFLYSIGYPKELKLLRASVNLTYSKPGGDSYGQWHVDHKFEHGQIIIGLNDDYVGGGTEVEMDDGSIKFLPTEKFKGYMFHAKNHRVAHPERGGRLVLVFTFEDYDDNLVGAQDEMNADLVDGISRLGLGQCEAKEQ